MTNADISLHLTKIKHQIESYTQLFHNYTFDPTNPSVKLHEPTFGSEEIWEAVESLLTTQVTMGAKVKEFESSFCKKFSFGNSSMVNSGSSANLLALSTLTNPALNKPLLPGDEVIVPALSWSTTIWPIIQHGLVPVIVDIDPKTLNIDPSLISGAISNKTRGIMIVHVYGNPCDMDAICDIADRNSLYLIEDCCEALGAMYKDKSVGSFGDIGTFSFYFSHHITTLEGGMCVTNNDGYAELIRVLRAHGWTREMINRDRHVQEYPDIDPRFLFINSGYNLRATELQGGFGNKQLPKLDKFISARSENAEYWRSAFSKYSEFFRFQQTTQDSLHSWFGFPMSVEDSAPFSTNQLCAFLNSRGIETRPIIAGNIAEQPAMQYYSHRIFGSLEHSDHVMRNGFTFGNHQAINGTAREYVANCLQEFITGHNLVK